MSEAAPQPPLDHEPQDIFPVTTGQSDADPARKVFDATDISVLHADIRPLMDRKAFSAQQRILNLASLAFDYYSSATGEDRSLFPDAATLESEYLITARSLFRGKTRDHQVLALQLNRELTRNLRKEVRRSPVPVAAKISGMEPMHEEPKIAEIITKLWLYEILEPGSSVSSELAKDRAAAKTAKRTRFRQDFSTPLPFL